MPSKNSNLSYSPDDPDSYSSDYITNYHVHIPMTPDRSMDIVPMDPAISARVEEQYVSNSLFTGGFNSATRAHLMDKVTDNAHPQLAGTNGSHCSVPGCDQKVMSDERGDDILPCECDFKICIDCFADAVKIGGGICPGCKERYRSTELKDLVRNGANTKALSLLAPPLTVTSGAKMERRLSMMKSRVLSRSQTGDFDHNRWLFETKGTYGYGNAIWPQENGNDKGDDGGNGGERAELVAKPWKPLTRKLKIPAAILSPYRY